jgi:hypothetical protein
MRVNEKTGDDGWIRRRFRLIVRCRVEKHIKATSTVKLA